MHFKQLDAGPCQPIISKCSPPPLRPKHTVGATLCWPWRLRQTKKKGSNTPFKNKKCGDASNQNVFPKGEIDGREHMFAGYMCLLMQGCHAAYILARQGSQQRAEEKFDHFHWSQNVIAPDSFLFTVPAAKCRENTARRGTGLFRALLWRGPSTRNCQWFQSVALKVAHCRPIPKRNKDPFTKITGPRVRYRRAPPKTGGDEVVQLKCTVTRHQPTIRIVPLCWQRKSPKRLQISYNECCTSPATILL